MENPASKGRLYDRADPTLETIPRSGVEGDVEGYVASSVTFSAF